MNRQAIQVLAVATPILLLASTSIFFITASQRLGNELGYLLGFSFYWLFWCLLAPWLMIRKQGFASLLIDRRPLFSRENWLAALLWGIVTIVALLMYGEDFIAAPPVLILLAIPLATINGVCEEMLWRGLYVRVFPTNPWLGIIYPAVGFAAWHFVPQILYPAEDVWAFVLSTLFLGLAYGFIAYRTGSARWTAISHSFNGAIALAAPLAQIAISIGKSLLP
jgi:membrane protease YdiL (CAAX protease family)